MSRLTNWLLIPPVSSRLSERYRHYRHHGASSLSAALGCFWMILAWMFIPLEHPRWQRIRARHGELYPHINPDKPRPLDPARYAIQSIWLLATSTGAEKKTSRWRSFDRVQNLREHYHQWLNRLPDRVGDRTGHLDNHKELGHLHPGLRRFILGVVVVFSLILALVCITQPFNPLAQFTFLILLWGVALLVRRIPGRFSALMIALFVLPHMIHASLTNSKIQGKYRHSFWSEIYETVLAWYIAPPTMVALINPHKGKFNVTAKGGLVEEEYVDWVISRPYIFLVLLNIVGVIVGVWRYFYGPENEILTVFVSMAWVFYNLIILGGAVAVSVESKQVRRAHRVEISMPAAIARDDGHLFSCTVHDFSDGGLGIKINGQAKVLEGQKVNLLLKRGQQEYVFPTQVVRVRGNEVGLQLMPLTKKQHIDFVQCTFARADTWALWQDSFPEDKPLESLLDILKLGFRGYRHLAEFAPSSVKLIFRSLTSLVSWVVSFIPRRPERDEAKQADPVMAQQ
ncbi:PilZ domain-containing protein [Enterobacter hormaechei]